MADLYDGLGDGGTGNYAQKINEAKTARQIDNAVLTNVVNTPTPTKSYLGGASATNNKNLITQKTQQQREAIRSAIAESLKVAKAERDNTISNIQSDEASATRESENKYYQAIPQLQERLANLGASSGGVQSRTENLGLETDRINTNANIASSATKLITDTNLAYNKLVSDGRVAEATQLAQLAGQELSNLLSESSRLDAFNLQKAQSQTQEAQADRTFGLETDKFNYGKTQDTITNALQKGQLLGTYTDPNSGEATDTFAKTSFDKDMAYKKDLADKDFAFKQSEMLGEVTQGLSDLTGIPVGILTSEQKFKDAQIQHNKDILAETIRSNMKSEAQRDEQLAEAKKTRVSSGGSGGTSSKGTAKRLFTPAQIIAGIKSNATVQNDPTSTAYMLGQKTTYDKQSAAEQLLIAQSNYGWDDTTTKKYAVQLGISDMFVDDKPKTYWAKGRDGEMHEYPVLE